jgi:hypothetical protein
MTKQTPQSGTSEPDRKLPKLLKYPKIKDVSERSDILNQYCYVFEPYESGLSTVIKYTDSGVWIVPGDWNGNETVPDGPLWGEVSELMQSEKFEKILQAMKTIALPQAQFYFAKDGKLVDIKLMEDKWSGPGMLRDLFGNVCDIQEQLEITVINDAFIQKQSTPVFLKPSRFKWVAEGEEAIPLYASLCL